MLPASNSNRRTPPSNNQKPELSSLSSDFPLIASADDYNWHLNGTGSGVDPASADWDITDGMVKMRINGDNIHTKMRTPSKIKTTGAGHESSPLETGSDASADSSSPPVQHLGLPSHSRGSSSDTTFSSHGSRTLQPSQYSANMDGEPWTGREQPSYPSLSARDQEFQVDYNAQQRQSNNAPNSALFPINRANNGGPNVQFRQPQPTRAFNHQVQNAVPNSQGFPYTSPHMSIGNTQQLYDMMMPNGQDPSMGRAQQQQQAFRGGHQHSASDPASLRDAAALQQLLVNNLQPFGGPGMYPPAALGQPALSLFTNQFYGTESYQAADIAAAQLMAARLQSQYQGAFGVNAGPAAGTAMSPTSAAAAAAAALAVVNGNGPSANNRKLGLYKTELCRSWEEKGTCRYSNKCQFAHGEDELRKVPRHPKYKTEICRTFWVSGSCPYGKRCCFIHTELPSNGGAPGSEGTPPPSQTVGRDRSSSTNSDPNDTSGSSLLARISAKRNQEVSSNGSGSASSTPPHAALPTTRPPMGSLRVDTSVLDPLASSAKQNKSAYPTLANGMLIQANAPVPIMTHGPVTAGPDFGRHASARLDIVGHNQQRMNKHQSRSSFNGSDNGTEHSPVAESPTILNIPRTSSRASTGHTRSGSAGNWNVSRSSNLASHTSYPLTSGPDVKPIAPWLTDASGGSSRLSSEYWG